MQILRILHLALGFGTALASARSAWLWWRASKVTLDLDGREQSGIHSLRQDALISATLQVLSESAALNSSAARWSAFAAILIALTVATGL